ncbi:four helix bundle protein [Luteitalea sp.]|uniref:four helix bundle protein n=1 Tax=Luteitalea sp. TaxID=2004800 RepID=UPI0025BF50CE|nr:four helix bundle protein [Luteitalea sp.]
MGRAITSGMPRDIQERAFALALRVVTLERDDSFRVTVRRVIVEQLVRAATSIGANLEEATGAQSKADFIARVGIARKEAREVQFWLRLGQEAGVVQAADWTGLLQEAEEVSRVVSAIARSAKRSTSRGD